MAFRQGVHGTPLPGERISFPLNLRFGGRSVKFGYAAPRRERRNPPEWSPSLPRTSKAPECLPRATRHRRRRLRRSQVGPRTQDKIVSATTAGLVSPDRMKGGRGDLLRLRVMTENKGSGT
jgi:hypothetical protein